MVEVVDLRRSFGRVRALDGARLAVRAGEVHAIVGENGAGKTTLVSILGGSLRADGGLVRVHGEPFEPRSPRDAWRAGIGLVYQHFRLVPALSVLENVALGVRSRARGWSLPSDEVRQRLGDLMDRTGLRVPVDEPVAGLPVGVRQRVEILKLLYRDPRVLVLDEPTAVLTPQETGELLTVLRRLADEGRAVVLIAHKLDEVLAVADRFTVLRRGRTVLEAERGRVDAAALARAMVGRDVTHPRRAAARPPGPEVAVLVDAHLHPPAGAPLRGASVRIRRGEIVGVAGVDGNGQEALAALLAGRAAPDAGEARLPEGIGFIPGDRAHQGLIGGFDLTENVALALYDRPPYRRGPWLVWGALVRAARALIERFGVRARGPRQRAAE
ncbi:MAG: ATP-binding cassette domain-containing protein, partial [Gemmatimonadetes bacterium]